MSLNNDDAMSNNIRELSNGMNWDTRKKMIECKCKKISIDGCACPSVAFSSDIALAKLEAAAEAKAGGLCLPCSQLCCTTGVRIGGNEEDYKSIRK